MPSLSGWPGTRAVTPVFDGLSRAMTVSGAKGFREGR